MTTTGAGAPRYFESADGLRLFYRDYAPVAAVPQLPLLCLPGLTRNSRDFTHVALRARERRRVLRAIPTLALRGATSDILAPATFARMKAEKPDLEQAEVPRRGHWPLLDEPVAVAAIDDFLARVP